MSCCPFFFVFFAQKHSFLLVFITEKGFAFFSVWEPIFCRLRVSSMERQPCLLEWRAKSKQNREMGGKTLIFFFLLWVSCLLTMRWLNPVHGRASKVNCNTICLSWLHSQIPSANSRRKKGNNVCKHQMISRNCFDRLDRRTGSVKLIKNVSIRHKLGFTFLNMPKHTTGWLMKSGIRFRKEKNAITMN